MFVEILGSYVGFPYWALANMHAACVQGCFYGMHDSLLGLLLLGGACESVQGLPCRVLADGLRDSIGFPCWVFHSMHVGGQGSIYMHEILVAIPDFYVGFAYWVLARTRTTLACKPASMACAAASSDSSSMEALAKVKFSGEICDHSSAASPVGVPASMTCIPFLAGPGSAGLGQLRGALGTRRLRMAEDFRLR